MSQFLARVLSIGHCCFVLLHAVFPLAVFPLAWLPPEIAVLVLWLLNYLAFQKVLTRLEVIPRLACSWQDWLGQTRLLHYWIPSWQISNMFPLWMLSQPTAAARLRHCFKFTCDLWLALLEKMLVQGIANCYVQAIWCIILTFKQLHFFLPLADHCRVKQCDIVEKGVVVSSTLLMFSDLQTERRYFWVLQLL